VSDNSLHLLYFSAEGTGGLEILPTLKIIDGKKGKEN